MRPRHVTALLAALSLGPPACSPSGGDLHADGPDLERRTPVHVDSIFPIEEELRRFRSGMDTTAALEGGAPSAGALVERLIAALEAADTAAVAGLALTRTEFAWIYYPHSMYTSRPYELAPGLVWYHLQNRSSRGLTRLLRRYAGEALHATSLHCPNDAEPFGPGSLLHGCVVRGELASGEAIEERLFGSILEVDGRHKLVGFSNEL